MRKKSIAKNYLYNLTFQIMTIILPLITTPYVSRALGAERIGIYSYTLSIVTYFVIVGSLGVSLYGQREIAYVQDDKHKRTKAFWEINIMRFITILLAVIVYYIFIIARSDKYEVYYKILLLELVAAAFDISWFFKGLEDFKKTVIRNIIIRLLSVTCVFIFVKKPDDLVKYVLIYSLGNALGSISLWFYLPKYLEGINLKHLDVYRHFIPVILLFIPQISNQVSNIMDKTMLGKMSTEAEVGYYEQSQKILRILISLTTSLGVVMMPRIANTFAIGDSKKAQDYMKKSLNFIFFLAFPMMLGLISVSDAFVPLFFGKGYDKVSTLMKVMSPTILLMGVSNVIGTQYLIPTKRQRVYTDSVLIGVVVNFVLNWILILKFTSVGACIATIICETMVLAIQLYYLRNEISISDIIKQSFRYVLSSLVMYAACSFIGIAVPYGILSILLKVVVGAVVYLSTLIIINIVRKKKKLRLSEE